MGQAAPTTEHAPSPPGGFARTVPSRIGLPVLLLLLYLLGVTHWAWFYRWGDLSFQSEDWPKERDYYVLLCEFVSSGRPPFHMSEEYQKTDRFLALPETNLSPQILLLPHVPLGRFMIANTVLLYSAGFVGCLLIRRRYRLGWAAFAMLFLLLNFNGFITSHLCVGHSMWNGYFLTPLVCLFVLEMVEEERSLRPALKLALTLFAMMMQGAFHMVIWWWMFLFLLVPFNFKYWKPILFVLAFSGWLSFCRLFPAAIAFWGDKDRGFWSGFPTLTDALDGLITLRGRNYPVIGSYVGSLRWWEYDFYIGLIGLGVLIYFGIYLRRRDEPGRTRCRYQALDAPMAILFFLSFNYFYAAIADLPIPLLNAEGVTSRFLIVPLALLVVVSAIHMQRWFETTRKTAILYVLVIGAILQTAFALGTHSYTWLPDKAEDPAASALSSIRAVSRPDRAYIASVYASAAVSAGALLVWFYAFLRVSPPPLTHEAEAARQAMRPDANS